MRRAGSRREIPPPLELECLKALWVLGHGTVHDVLELVRDRKLAYTTVMTVLDRLAIRDAVTRQKEGRAFIYRPKLTRDALRPHAVKQLVDTFFDGSRQELLEYLSAAPAAEAGPLASEPGVSHDAGEIPPSVP